MPLRPFQASKPQPTGAEEDKPLLLYVEDDLNNQKVIGLRLRSKYRMLFASNDKEACKIFFQRGKEIDAILMDIELKDSELNGIQLVKLIRQSLEATSLPVYAKNVPSLETPVIFVTAYGNHYPEVVRIKAMLIHKPVNFAELEMALSRSICQRTK